MFAIRDLKARDCFSDNEVAAAEGEDAAAAGELGEDCDAPMVDSQSASLRASCWCWNKVLSVEHSSPDKEACRSSTMRAIKR